MSVEAKFKILKYLDEWREELKVKMKDEFRREVLELIQCEKEWAEAADRFNEKLEQVKRDIKCPICLKKGELNLTSRGGLFRIHCNKCGLSTGETYSLTDLFRIWLTFDLAFKNNLYGLQELVKGLQEIGAAVKVEANTEEKESCEHGHGSEQEDF